MPSVIRSVSHYSDLGVIGCASTDALTHSIYPIIIINIFVCKAATFDQLVIDTAHNVVKNATPWQEIK